MLLGRVFALILAPILLTSCFKGGSDGTVSGAGTAASESAFCSDVTSYSNPVTVTTDSTGATFKTRTVSTSGLGSSGNAKPIKYAEVQVLNSAGATIQCGETNGNGQVSVQIPKTAGTYTLKVLSRASNSYYKASILNVPSASVPYSISTTFTLDGSESTKTVTLPAADTSGDVAAGAFNILDQVFRANEYLRNNSTCPSQGSVCSQFTVAPKIKVYWAPGISPNAYLGDPSSAVSFYNKTESGSFPRALYMGGGTEGDYTCTDTDHFDNSIILHEYGHFLEDTYGSSDSPGGSHNGNAIIDPRLAWSEGWANFFQAAVRSTTISVPNSSSSWPAEFSSQSPNYLDTVANSDCSGGTYLGVHLDLEDMTAATPATHDYMGATTTSGEGIFREVSVSRILWDTMSSKTGGDSKGAEVGFAFIWKIFSDTSNGFGNTTSIRFRNVGLFNYYMSSLISASYNSQSADYATALSNEYQVANTSKYAGIRTFNGTCSSIDIAGTSNSSNQFKSNHFYAYYYDGTNPTIRLQYSTKSGSTSAVDLDLYVYVDDYVYGSRSDMAGYSEGFHNQTESPNGTETVSLSGRSTGWYLVNVRVDGDTVGATNASTYTIDNGSGVQLCP